MVEVVDANYRGDPRRPPRVAARSRLLYVSLPPYRFAKDSFRLNYQNKFDRNPGMKSVEAGGS